MLQENEIVKVPLSEFIVGSFLSYNLMFDEIILPNPVFSISEHYNEMLSGELGYIDQTSPLHNSARLMIVNDEDNRQRTFVLIVDESYSVTIIDFSKLDNFKSTVVFEEDLSSMMMKHIGGLTREPIYCDGLTTIVQDSTYSFSCRAGFVQFIVFMKFTRNKTKFKLNTFIENSELFLDLKGRNMMTCFVNGDYGFFISSAASRNDFLFYTVMDLTKFDYQRVPTIKSFGYDYGDFTNPFEKDEILQKRFNIRDVISYRLSPALGEGKSVFSIIVT